MFGCAGAGTNNRISFDSARYPVSLSSCVPSAGGWNLEYGYGSKDLEKLGTFNCRKRGWSIVWGFVPLHTVDFSKELNEAVERAGGEAIVNLEIKSVDSGVNWWIFIHWIPLWPGCVKVEVTGTIVRRPKITGLVPLTQSIR